MSKSKTVNFSLPDVLIKRLKEVAADWGITQSEAVRRMISEAYDALQKKDFGYKGSKLARRKISKEDAYLERQESIEQLRAMSNDALTAWCVQNSFFEQGDPNAGMDYEMWVISGEGDARKIMKKNYEYGSGAVLYSRDVYSWNEFITALIKEGKI